jgi:hypothetical protein
MQTDSLHVIITRRRVLPMDGLLKFLTRFSGRWLFVDVVVVAEVI